MNVEQFKWTKSNGWQPNFPGELSNKAQLVLLFGARSILEERGIDDIVKAYPHAKVFGCSTAGEIINTQVLDDSLVVTAVHLENTRVNGACVKIADFENIFAVGERLAESIAGDGLAHTMVLSEGIGVNGSDLVRGITKHLPKGVTVTGGLAGDGADFFKTCVIYDGKLEYGSAAIIGFYGDKLFVGYASAVGWDPFGPDRLITKSDGNVLYELDGRSALELYKKYVGEYAGKMPGGLTAMSLFFPLGLRMKSGDERRVVRAFLAFDEEKQSMSFAGDVPVGCYARLMKANFDHLLNGAVDAAQISRDAIGHDKAEIALLINCIARKLVLKQRTEEEIEAVHNVLGSETVMTGFYSYGEIAPFMPGVDADLHNQSMTITTLRES
ncbi:FIST C-terminal domain-containing protein [bacterium]|nr:FIST C-terminal domain-containing protein [bacterium]